MAEPELPLQAPARRPRPRAVETPAWPALEELVRAHFAEVQGLLARLVGNRSEAEDLAQECFVRVERARGAAGAARAAEPRAYLLTVAANLARDWHRRRGRRGATAEVPAELTVPGVGPEGAAMERELQEALRAEVALLPDPPRSSFVERVLLGREYADVARDLGLEPGTVRIQVMNARKRLARALAPFLREDA